MSYPRDRKDSLLKKIANVLVLVIIPSSSKTFQEKRVSHFVNERREASRDLAMCLDPDTDTVTDPRRLDLLMSKHREKVAICQHIEGQISKLERDIEATTEIAATESCRIITGYKGIRDWASETWDAYSDLVHAISTICFVGAGLTYSSIFGATRGDLGLMAWAFSLFIVGMIISVTVEAFLVQCARLEDYPFITQRLWEICLGIFIYTACFAVVTAICLLLLTVLQLHFTDGPSGAGDSLLIFNISPRPPALLGFSAIGVGLFFAFVVIGVFMLANGANALLWRRWNLRNKQNEKGRRLDEIV